MNVNFNRTMKPLCFCATSVINKQQARIKPPMHLCSLTHTYMYTYTTCDTLSKLCPWSRIGYVRPTLLNFPFVSWSMYTSSLVPYVHLFPRFPTSRFTCTILDWKIITTGRSKSFEENRKFFTFYSISLTIIFTLSVFRNFFFINLKW